jgi:hypothetical protein
MLSATANILFGSREDLGGWGRIASRREHGRRGRPGTYWVFFHRVVQVGRRAVFGLALEGPIWGPPPAIHRLHLSLWQPLRPVSPSTLTPSSLHLAVCAPSLFQLPCLFYPYPYPPSPLSHPSQLSFIITFPFLSLVPLPIAAYLVPHHHSRRREASSRRCSRAV